jgi:hypothetical protein
MARSKITATTAPKVATVKSTCKKITTPKAKALQKAAKKAAKKNAAGDAEDDDDNESEGSDEEDTKTGGKGVSVE